MPHAVPAQNNKEQASPLIHRVPSSRRSRWWLSVFYVVLVVLVAGVLLTIWPRYRVTITPLFDQFTVTVPVKVDLNVTEVISGSNIVPGQLVDNAVSAAGGRRVIGTTKAGRVMVSDSDVDSLLQRALQQAAGGNEVLVENTFSTLWQPVKTSSASTITVPVSASGKFRNRFHTADWPQHLAGLSVKNAIEWLTEQPGVAKATIEVYPSFFANISQKLPKDPNRLTWLLDINGKVSILKER